MDGIGGENSTFFCVYRDQWTFPTCIFDISIVLCGYFMLHGDEYRQVTIFLEIGEVKPTRSS